MSSAGVDRKEDKKEKEAEKGINREETAPFLLRVFCAQHRHNNIREYAKGNTPENEVQIYTWLDASLKELTGLIKEVNPEARRKGTMFEFALVYPDLRMGNYLSRDIGNTSAGNKGNDDSKTLGDAKFSIGDYLNVAISPPNRRTDRMDYGRRGGGGGFGDRRSFGGRRDEHDMRDRLDSRGGDRNGGDRMGGDRIDRDRPMDRDREDRGRDRMDRGREDRGGRDRDRVRDRS